MRLRTKYTYRLPGSPGLRLDIPMFEGSGTKVLDVSGKGNHGTITDAVWTRDENGVAMSFNGTSAYIDCGNNASLNPTDTITIEAWTKIEGTGDTTQSICIKDIQGSVIPYYFNYSKANNKPRFTFYSGNWQNKTTQTLTGQYGVWQHLVVTFDKPNLHFFINGVDDGLQTFNYTLPNNSGAVLIGRYGYNRYFRGTIDEVRIYSDALTAEQIKRRYEQTKRDYVRAH